MAIGRHSKVLPTWTIRSVALRTRDGPERLDQAYRRLLTADAPDGKQPAGSDMSPTEAVVDRVQDARR